MEQLPSARCSATLDEAAQLLGDAQVLLLFTGAGFSADSGLAVYDDVAKVKAYQDRSLDYMDLCDPKLVHQEPPLFWGFWGQCFNDYRTTAPHQGYEILSRWVEQRFHHSETAQRMRAILSSSCETSEYTSFDSLPAEPYEVSGHAGAFYVFTSNVDAHHYDWFQPYEIRECHGNVELYQCSFGRARCGPGLWRAPRSFRFAVEPGSLLAFAEVPTPEALRPAGAAGAAGPALRHVGAVASGAERRSTLLRYMPEGQTPEHLLARSFSENHPKCARCRAAARPAVLMFGEWGDKEWLDSQGQVSRWSNFMQGLGEVVAATTNLRCVLLEIGAGTRVPTVRQTSEQILEVLLSGGANAKLLRVNPKDAEPDDADLAEHILSFQSTGLEFLRAVDALLPEVR
ncbi:Hypothetical protein (Fragment) [Durusdinium trenchii]|uniref:Deacetylase sirtuin-type domain-containing protein n=1 Tax=Durusdinium trenchii TaxID=1381693 RepID=A0ABP0Q5P8_9DINO